MTQIIIAKKASPYNEFMKKNIPKYKLEHPEVDHNTAFVAVSNMWRTAPENPNRIRK